MANNNPTLGKSASVAKSRNEQVNGAGHSGPCLPRQNAEHATKDSMVKVRVGQGEKERWEQCAQRAGMPSVAHLIRAVMSDVRLRSSEAAAARIRQNQLLVYISQQLLFLRNELQSTVSPPDVLSRLEGLALEIAGKRGAATSQTSPIKAPCGTSHVGCATSRECADGSGHNAHPLVGGGVCARSSRLVSRSIARTEKNP